MNEKVPDDDSEESTVVRNWRIRVDREFMVNDRSRVGRAYFPSNVEPSFGDNNRAEVEASNYDLKMALVDDFEYKFLRNEVEWLD